MHKINICKFCLKEELMVKIQDMRFASKQDAQDFLFGLLKSVSSDFISFNDFLVLAGLEHDNPLYDEYGWYDLAYKLLDISYGASALYPDKGIIFMPMIEKRR